MTVRCLQCGQENNPQYRFCGVCGFTALPERAGHVIRCTNETESHEFFPRIDPAIIVLITDGERALLGRQASWPPGRYSTIAGFVEPGESMEEAVRRELAEEVELKVGDVRYHAAQPWPFPSSRKFRGREKFTMSVSQKA